jgi:hypothetical protein
MSASGKRAVKTEAEEAPLQAKTAKRAKALFQRGSIRLIRLKDFMCVDTVAQPFYFLKHVVARAVWAFSPVLEDIDGKHTRFFSLTLSLSLSFSSSSLLFSYCSTYSFMELVPGANLNVIVGPNGKDCVSLMAVFAFGAVTALFV